MDTIKARKKELEEKNALFKNNYLLFDQYFKENDLKVSRAVKKAADERKLLAFKSIEMARLKEEVQALIEAKRALSNKVNKLQKFHDYLELVLDSARDYEEIQKLIFRYETLDVNFRETFSAEQENVNKLMKQTRDEVQYEEVGNVKY
jgi:hypothetical protein